MNWLMFYIKINIIKLQFFWYKIYLIKEFSIKDRAGVCISDVTDVTFPTSADADADVRLLTSADADLHNPKQN